MSTSITVEFQVNDLDANYEVLGTSDNYSFQEKLGLGSNLVLNEGEEFVKVIPLKGNYGVFDIRVFAVTDIGVRSPSLIGSVEVLPKQLQNTFTFSEIKITDNRYENLESSITYTPQSPGDKLEVESEFAERSIKFSWNLVPPDGHPLEGTAVSNQLLNDTFFSGFKINIKNNGETLDLSDAGFSSTSLDALANTFETDKENVVDILQNYRDFYLNFDENVFNDLGLSRNVELEVISVDRFGREATGIIRATNPEPTISNLTHSLRGSEASFSWTSQDVDFNSVDVNVLAVPEGTTLPFEQDLELNAKYFQSLKQAKPYNKYKGAYYNDGEKVVYDNKVYNCISGHARQFNETPDYSESWELVGDVVDFNYFSSADNQNKNLIEDVSLSDAVDIENTFNVPQLWGYEYYYTFQPSDGFGEGQIYNFTNRGLVRKGDENDALDPLIVSIKLDNLRFREVKDDLVFNWDVTDQDGNLVDISQYKFLFGNNDAPSLLGISGSLYDIHTRQKITGITDGYNSKGLDFDEDGDLVVNANLPSTKVFDQYKYTRESNNAIYGTGGFPANYQDYDDQAVYNIGDNVLSNNKIYTSNTNNNSYDPTYSTWKESETYFAATSDKFVYKNNVYVATSDFGADADTTSGLYNEGESYSLGDIVLSPEKNITIFSEQEAYNPGDFVFHSGSIYECLIDISTEEIALIGNTDYWRRSDIFGDIKCSYFKSLTNSNTSYPFSNTSNWEKVNPESLATNGQFFDVFAPAYEFSISDWSSGNKYSSGSFVVYENDIWSGTQSSQGQIPSGTSEYWANNSNGQDFGTGYQAGDLVYSNNFIYQCTQNNPAGGPIVARTNEGDTILSSYQDTNWLPFWELNDQYDDIVFGHVGIPQSGKRSVGIELGIVDKYGKIVNKANLDADNPAPYILTEGFKVDSTSEATKVKFSFNYALGFQEKTTKVHLYRSTGDVFDITGADGLPYEKVISQIAGSVNVISGSNEVSGINTLFLSELKNDSVVKIEDQIFSVDTIIDDENLTLSSNSSKDVVGGGLYKNADSTLVSITLGAEDAAFGENINQIIDEPPIPSINGVDQITGYYYKILPFDDFGSGVLYNVPDGSVDQVIVYPKRYNNPNPNVMPGRVLRADPTVAAGAVPGKISNFSGSTAFENYFLNWNAPTADYEPGSTKLLNWTENDIDHYEVWATTGKSNASEDKYLKSGITQTQAINWLESQNTGYRKIQGVAYSVGQLPREDPDPARYVYGAENIFNVPANSPSSEVVYPGETNDSRSFWIRAVDFAGNKSPFVGGAQPGINDPISGLTLTLGEVKATNISGFESSITNKFYNTIALNPNNPFDNIQNGWGAHSLYHTGQEYSMLSTGDGMSDGYIWWQTGNNYYNTGAVHPATTKETDPNFTDFNDGDFIIARVTNGNATPVFHAFANALIGTANIAEASIINAQINDLAADKITAGEIKSADIQISAIGGEAGVVRSVGFTGIVPNDPTKSGFYLSGDGTFAFQAGGSSLSFEDDTLTLRGKLRQSNGFDYDFIDLDVVPSHFNYIQAENGFEDGQSAVETFVPDTNSPSSLTVTATFRNSSVVSTGVRFRMDVVSGDNVETVFGYNDFTDGDLVEDGEYNISGFIYDPNAAGAFRDDSARVETKVASGTFALGGRYDGNNTEHGFDHIIDAGFAGLGLADSVILYVSGLNSTYEKSVTITRINDGRIGDDGATGNNGLTPTYRGIWDAITNYVHQPSTAIEPGRGDIVYFPLSHNDRDPGSSNINSNYFIAIEEGSGNLPIVDDPPGSNTNWKVNDVYWKEFGAELENVATNLLLTKEAFITEKLTMGVGGSATEVPHSGIIVSSDFVGGIYDVHQYKNVEDTSLGYEKLFNCAYYDLDFDPNVDLIRLAGQSIDVLQWNDDSITLTEAEYNSLPAVHYFKRRGGYIMDLGKDQFVRRNTDIYETGGFLLGRLSDDRAVFDVGGTGILGNSSYIRFDSQKGKIEIQGSFINNTILAPNFDINQLQYTDDPFGAFVGGGYNNQIGVDEDGAFNSLGSAIVAGASNINDSRFSFIGAGFSGECRDNFSFIGAGYQNSMPIEEPTDHQGANFIGCGVNNQVNGGSSQSIVNGVSNTINGLTGNYIPHMDFDNGLFSKRVLGRYEGDNGEASYDHVSFSETNYGYTDINSGVWFPAGIEDGNSTNPANYYINNWSQSLYIGEIKGLNDAGWVYHKQLDWCYMITDFIPIVYSNDILDFVYIYVSKNNFPSAYGGWFKFQRIGAKRSSNEVEALYSADINFNFNQTVRLRSTSVNNLAEYYDTSNSQWKQFVTT